VSSELVSFLAVALRYRGVRAGSWHLEVSDFRVGPGQIHLLTGDNMSGKSTFVRFLAGIETDIIASGEIRRLGAPVATGADLADLSVMLSSEDIMFPELSVEENVTLGVDRGDLTPDWPEAARKLFADAGVFGDRGLKSPLATLSSGGMSIVKFCRALVSRRPLVLMDEVSSFLDPERARLVLAAAIEFARSGRAFVIVSHNVRDREYLVANFPTKSYHISRHQDRSVLTRLDAGDA
jgi:ABC-type sugar transport system ATPase subunit